MSRTVPWFVIFLCGAAVASSYDWSAVDTILEAGIANETYPGCVAVVADKTGVVYAKAHGSFTYGIAPPFSGGVNPAMTMETRFDMASCTKVLASTTSAALLYQWGYLDLDTPVADPEYLGPDFAQNGKGSVTVRHCLLHNAGFPPDPSPNYWEKAFDCPETRKTVPEENFSCRAKWWDSLLKQGLARAPNVAYVYSDLSLITIGMVVGKIAYTRNLVSSADILPGCLTDTQNPSAPPTQAAIYQCYFEAFFRTQVADALGLRNTGFLPPQSVWGQCAPAENDTFYAGKTIQGQVSDGNTYAMGGIAGHAGLFTTAMEALTIMQTWLFGTHPELLSPAVAKYFYTEHNHTQSSRALGWNTNDPDVFDQGWALSCGSKLSAATFMHTGYTGTEVCADPQFPTGGLITILLTNRVYPTDKTGSTKIGNIRRLFNNAVADILLSKTGEL